MANLIGAAITLMLSIIIWSAMAQVPSQKELGMKVLAEGTKNTTVSPITSTANNLMEAKGNVESGTGMMLIRFFSAHPILFFIICLAIVCAIYFFT